MTNEDEDEEASDEEEEEDNDDKEEASENSDPPPQKHRVTTKGSNVPQEVDSFEALKERYQMSSHLLANLSRNGYTRPTGIQSYGIPILLEVSRTLT